MTKTEICRAVAADMGWDVRELHATDLRSVPATSAFALACEVANRLSAEINETRHQYRRFALLAHLESVVDGLRYNLFKQRQGERDGAWAAAYCVGKLAVLAERLQKDRRAELHLLGLRWTSVAFELRDLLIPTATREETR